MQPDIPEFWIDLNLPPQIAMWLREDFDVDAKSFRELNFDSVPDSEEYKDCRCKNKYNYHYY